MKKLLLLFVTVLGMVACEKYDDSALRTDIANLQGKSSEQAALITDLQSQVDALSAQVDAIDFVSHEELTAELLTLAADLKLYADENDDNTQVDLTGVLADISAIQADVNALTAVSASSEAVEGGTDFSILFADGTSYTFFVADGENGAVGPKGADGEAGAPGAQGPKGDAGDNGLAGLSFDNTKLGVDVFSGDIEADVAYVKDQYDIELLPGQTLVEIEYGADEFGHFVISNGADGSNGENGADGESAADALAAQPWPVFDSEELGPTYVQTVEYLGLSKSRTVSVVVSSVVTDTVSESSVSSETWTNNDSDELDSLLKTTTTYTHSSGDDVESFDVVEYSLFSDTDEFVNIQPNTGGRTLKFAGSIIGSVILDAETTIVIDGIDGVFTILDVEIDSDLNTVIMLDRRVDSDDSSARVAVDTKVYFTN